MHYSCFKTICRILKHAYNEFLCFTLCLERFFLSIKVLIKDLTYFKIFFM